MRCILLFACLFTASASAFGQDIENFNRVLSLQQQQMKIQEQQIQKLNEELARFKHPPIGTMSYLGPITMPNMPPNRFLATHFSNNTISTDFLWRAKATADRFCRDKGRTQGAASYDMQEAVSSCGIVLFNNAWSNSCGSNFSIFKVIHCL